MSEMVQANIEKAKVAQKALRENKAKVLLLVKGYPHKHVRDIVPYKTVIKVLTEESYYWLGFSTNRTDYEFIIE